MKRIASASMACFAIGLFIPSLHAQLAVTTRIDRTDDTIEDLEPAVAVVGAEVLVVWNRLGGVAHYAVSLSGGAAGTFSTAAPFPLPQTPCTITGVFDPGVAFSRQYGEMFASGLVRTDTLQVHTVIAARRPAGQQVLVDPRLVISSCSVYDKPLMALGPFPLQTTPQQPQALYVGYWGDGQDYGELWTSPSLAVSPTGSAWDTTPNAVSDNQTQAEGQAPCLAVMPYNAVVPGRLLNAHSLPWNDPVIVSRSDDGGVAGNWILGSPLVDYDLPAPGGRIKYLTWPPEDLVPGNVRTFTTPCLVIDPTSPQNVLVLFPALAGSADPDHHNVDIFVARSTNAGISFAPANTRRLTDALFGQSSGTDQWQPWMDIDPFGGVSIVFSWSPDPDSVVDPNLVRVYTRFAHWCSIDALMAGNTPAISIDLPKPGSQQVAVSRAWAQEANDYKMVAAGVGYAVMAWPYRDYNDTAKGWQMMVTRVNTASCTVTADFNLNGTVEATDAALFTAAYNTADPSADLNRDTVVTAADAALFCQSYACGCNP